MSCIDDYFMRQFWVLNYFYLLHGRVVTYQTGKTLADSWKAAFFESSAKENSVSRNAKKIYMYIYFVCYNHIKKHIVLTIC